MKFVSRQHNTSLPVETEEKLLRLARRLNVPKSKLMREAIADYLPRLEASLEVDESKGFSFKSA